jgi:hypothetical protein
MVAPLALCCLRSAQTTRIDRLNVRKNSNFIESLHIFQFVGSQNFQEECSSVDTHIQQSLRNCAEVRSGFKNAKNTQTRDLVSLVKKIRYELLLTINELLTPYYVRNAGKTKRKSLNIRYKNNALDSLNHRKTPGSDLHL